MKKTMRPMRSPVPRLPPTIPPATAAECTGDDEPVGKGVEDSAAGAGESVLMMIGPPGMIDAVPVMVEVAAAVPVTVEISTPFKDHSIRRIKEAVTRSLTFS